MHCTACFKEIEASNKAYAIAIGSIEQNNFGNEEDFGFYASEVEPWLTVLCVNCGRTVHNFILKKLQAKHL